jgi:hypothetical protein
MLRVLRLPEQAVEPSPVACNADIALDRGFAREGWLVVIAHPEVRGLPVPLEGERFSVGYWWDCVPAPNPRTVWLANPGKAIDDSQPTVVTEYDGVLRRELRRRELPGFFRLQAAVRDGLVLRTQDRDGLWIWRWDARDVVPLTPAREVLGAHDATLAVLDPDDQLEVFDSCTGRRTPIAKPLPGKWASRGSFSPDGTRFALDLEEHRAEVDGGPVEILAAMMQPAWSRLVLVTCATGATNVPAGRFDNFASTPVWTADGRWLLFDAPFDTSLFALDTHAPAPELTPVVRRRGRPSPLIDITALIV